MHVLAIGDRFIEADEYPAALAAYPDLKDGPIRTVGWHGEKAWQHAQQQIMERSGPNAVTTPPELVEAIPGAQILCVHFAPVSARLLRSADRLGVIVVARAGLENIDIAEATERGIGVVGIQGRNASAVAELQIGLLLSETRNIARADHSVKSGGWRKDFPGPLVELTGRTVGMVGFGHVGAHFATKLAGFRPRLIAYDPYADRELLDAYGVRPVSTLDEVFTESDFVVVQARHTAETDRFIGADQFELMKRGAYFVNVARSRLVDTDALYEALAEGRIAGAGLDVHDHEPLPADSPWRKLDNVTMTTHFGGDTVDTEATSVRLVAEAAAEYAATGTCLSAVNARELGWA